MNNSIPFVIRRYFEAVQLRDFSIFSEIFAADAVVGDEHSRYEGVEAIRAWMEGAVAEYDQTSEVQEVLESEGGYLCRCLVSGNFDGSPLMIDHLFVLAGDRIVSLTID